MKVKSETDKKQEENWSNYTKNAHIRSVLPTVMDTIQRAVAKQRKKDKRAA